MCINCIKTSISINNTINFFICQPLEAPNSQAALSIYTISLKKKRLKEGKNLSNQNVYPKLIKTSHTI